MRGELIIRIDDVVDVTERLEALWQVLEKHGVPVHLGVIPNDLTPAAAARLRERAARSTARVSVQQHGYRHVNHGQGKHKFEFSDERDAGEQRDDLANGMAILAEHFPTLFDRVFVPPWDRCGQSALDAMADLGFAGVSVIETSTAPTDPRVPRVPMTTDPVTWRPSPAHRPWDETLRSVTGRLERDGYAGIELHHEVMDDAAMAGLDGMLQALGGLTLPTMAEMARRVAPGD